MGKFDSPLIVGAGPVGLAAGLFLSQAGLNSRLVEMSKEPSRLSKALAVNPRTLEILEPMGVTERLLEIGTKINGACLWRGGKIAASIDFAHRLKCKYPFMLAISQATTEQLLEEALIENGGFVERDTKLVSCQSESGRVRATIVNPRGTEVLDPTWILAADGAHSTAREQMGIQFSGSTLRNQWQLADVPLDVELAEDRAHGFFCPKGEFQFMIRVVDPQMERTVSGRLWRVIGNRPDLLNRLATGRLTGSPVWESAFTVSHRMNRVMSIDNMYFAGDAAHIHSPVGARGMNLGIEDAWVFAQLAQRDGLSRYAQLRYPIDRSVVRQVSLVSRIVAGEPSIFGTFRSMIPLVIRLGLPSHRMMAIVTGTDHPLGEFEPSHKC